MDKIFGFLEKYLMGPMGKVSQFKIVRAVMAAGMASIPFTIVGSMFLVFNVFVRLQYMCYMKIKK